MAITQAPKSPGKTSSPRSATPSSVSVSAIESPRDKDRREGVEGVFQFASMFALMRGQYADAGAFSLHAPNIGHEAALLGKKNEQIGKVLDLLGQAGPYAGIAFAVLPLVAQLAVNHERIEADKAVGIKGVMPKAALENKVKAELAEMELAALQERKRSEEALAQLKAERGEQDELSKTAA